MISSRTLALALLIAPFLSLAAPAPITDSGTVTNDALGLRDANLTLTARDSNSYCGAEWHWDRLSNYFYVYGKFDAGPYAKNLYDKLNKIGGGGCGLDDGWTFQKLTHDPRGFTWKATGYVPGGQRACVGDAVVAVGGNDRSGCKGAG